MSKIKHLRDVYRFTNFYPEFSVKGVFGDPLALVIRLRRRQKKHSAESVAKLDAFLTTRKAVTFGTSGPVIGVSICGLILAVWIVVGALV